MNNFFGVTAFWQILLIVSLLVVLSSIIFRINQILKLLHRRELADKKGSAQRGIFYAFTLGMLPWQKESTRRHWIEYIRGILFHLGIFASLVILLLSLRITELLPGIKVLLGIVVVTGIVAGAAGLIGRFSNRSKRALSNLDDYNFSSISDAVYGCCLYLSP